MLGDLILSIVLLAMGGGVLISTSKYPDFGALSVIGPEFLPNIMSYFFIFSAVIFLVKLIIKAFVKKVDENGNSYLEMEQEKIQTVCHNIFRKNLRTNLNVVIIIAMIVVYGVLLPYVGYEILTVIFMVISLLLNGVRKPRILILVPILTLIAIYVVFVLVLKVQIPRVLL